jgi:hypothetical protein
MKGTRMPFQPCKKEFTNELGNKICVTVVEQSDCGKNPQGINVIFHGVKITIIGPTSMSENTLTIEESVSLLECLKVFHGK